MNPNHDELGRFSTGDEARAVYADIRRSGGVPLALMDEEERETAERSARARSTYKPSTRAKQIAAVENERELAEALGAKHKGGNQPVDVVFENEDGEKVGIEVKTFVDNKNDKVTVHPESRERKERWARRNKASLFTVLFDERKGPDYSGHPVYVAEGVGAFRLGSMRPTTMRELRKELRAA